MTEYTYRSAVIEELSRRDGRVHGIRLRRNFGKAAALSAGFRAARKDLVFTLDADLQDDPAEIPRFLARVAEDLDVVSGWKQVRHDPWHKVWPSRVSAQIRQPSEMAEGRRASETLSADRAKGCTPW